MKLSSFSPNSSSTLRRLAGSIAAGLQLTALVTLGACATTDPEDAGMTDSQSTAAGAMWVGRTFSLTIPSTRWSSPRGVGDDIGPFVPIFLIRVDGATGNTLDVTVGTAKPDGTQDLCGTTTKFTGMSAGFPAATIGAGNLPVLLRNEEIAANTTIMNLSFENVLPDGVTPTEDMEGIVRATMDFASTVNLFKLLVEKTTEAACAAAADGLMAPCEPCPDDPNRVACLSLVADGVGAGEYLGAPMVDVATETRGPECMNMVPAAM